MPDSADSHFVRVAAVGEIAPGTGKEVIVGGRVVALFHIDGEFLAIDGICAHAGGPLAKGKLDGCIVTCPWHGWQYDLRTGRHCLTPHIRQTQFAVRVEKGEVWVRLEV